MSKLSRQTLADIASLAREITTAHAGRNPDVHQDDNNKICRMYDELDGLASAEAMRSMALEILHLRSLAEQRVMRVEINPDAFARLRGMQQEHTREWFQEQYTCNIDVEKGSEK